MELVGYKDVLDAIGKKYDQFNVEALQGGLIHRTWKIFNESTRESFLLQKINTHVFQNPLHLSENYRILHDHLEKKGFPFIIPDQIPFQDGNFLHRDNNHDYWRLFSFIEEDEVPSPVSIEHVRELGHAFGRLLLEFNDLDPQMLQVTISDFHNLEKRFEQFYSSVKNAVYNRMHSASDEITSLLSRKHYVELYRDLTAPGRLPVRVVHQDAKPSNVLIDDSGKLASILDFDTAMPGYIFSDLGDLIRSTAVNENLTAEEVTIDEDLYYALVESYLEAAEPVLTSLEKKFIHFSGVLMTYMQALRFMEDYLAGDRYYRISYPTQNLDRAKSQLKLLEKLEQFLSK